MRLYTATIALFYYSNFAYVICPKCRTGEKSPQPCQFYGLLPVRQCLRFQFSDCVPFFFLQPPILCNLIAISIYSLDWKYLMEVIKISFFSSKISLYVTVIVHNFPIYYNHSTVEPQLFWLNKDWNDLHSKKPGLSKQVKKIWINKIFCVHK